MEKQVPGVLRDKLTREPQNPNPLEVYQAVQGAGERNNLPPPWAQYRTGDWRAERIHERLVELFRYYRIVQPFTSLGPLDQTTPPGGYLETLEESPNQSRGTPQKRGFSGLCCNDRMLQKGAMAYEQSQVGSYRLAGFLLYITRACVPLDLNTALISRIAVYGPVRTVVWEGGVVRLLPIPMCAFNLFFYLALVNLHQLNTKHEDKLQIKKKIPLGLHSMLKCKYLQI